MQPIDSLVIPIVAECEPQILRNTKVGTGDNGNMNLLKDVPSEFLRRWKP